MNNLQKCGQCGKLRLNGETVTISVSEYHALREAANSPVHRADANRYRRASRSVIARNPELADFIVNSVQTMTIAEVHKAAVEEFGPSIPSRSSFHRFLQVIGAQ